VKVTVERLPESQVRLEIAADEAEFAEAVEQAAKRVSRQVNIHGFRPGKAPRHMI
jgi:trigger factor